MDGLFTANWEVDADRIAPKLAKVSVAAGLYFWLHSRVFATKNNVGISHAQLASILNASPRSVSRAVDTLTEAGLITKETYRGNGGGSVFHLCGVENRSDLSYLPANKCDESGLLNTTNSVTDTANVSHLKGRNRQITNSTYKEEGDGNRVYGEYD